MFGRRTLVETLAILCTLLMATGQISIKTGLTNIGGFSGEGTTVISQILKAIGNPFILFGVLLYLVASITWIWVLSLRPLSYIYPFLALTYVFALIGSKFLLHEDVNMLRWIGVAVIAAGIFLVSRS